MSPMLSTLMIAWIAIALLALACSGLLRQIRELRAMVTHGVGAPLAVGGGGAPTGGAPSNDPPRAVPPALLDNERPTVLLKVDSKCVDCHAAMAELERLAPELAPRARLVVLADRPDKAWPTGGDIDVIIDDDLYRQLRTPWVPALVVADASGIVASSGPVRQPGVLTQAVHVGLDTLSDPTALKHPEHTG